MANKPGEANFFHDVPQFPSMGTFQPVYGKFDLTTYIQGASDYEIMAFLVGKYNACLEAYGTVTKLSIDTVTAAHQLQDWINSWFDNLDVQEEINNRLDTMVSNGTFSELLKPLLNEYTTELAEVNNNYKNLQTQVNDLVLNAGNPDATSAEIAQARGGYSTLNNRLANMLEIKTTLPTDANAAEPGIYFIATDQLSNVANLPNYDTGLMLISYYQSWNENAVQMCINFANYEYEKTIFIRSKSATVWSDWSRLNTNMTPVTGNVDLNKLFGHEGTYYIYDLVSAINSPVPNPSGILYNVTNGETDYEIQLLISSINSMWIRTKRDSTINEWTLISDGKNALIGRVYSTPVNDANKAETGWYAIGYGELASWSNLPPRIDIGCYLITMNFNSPNALQLCVSYSINVCYRDIWTRSKAVNSDWGEWIQILGTTNVNDIDLNNIIKITNVSWHTGANIANSPFGSEGAMLTSKETGLPDGLRQEWSSIGKTAPYAKAIRQYYNNSLGDWCIIRDREYNTHMGFTAIVDSLGSGWIEKYGTATAGQFYQQSWCQYLANKMGWTFYISGSGGVSTADWLNESAPYGISKLKRLPKTPIYFIGLGANDVNQNIPKDTYVSNYKKIIETVKAIQPGAIVFCCATGRFDTYAEYDAAMQAMVNDTYTFATDHVAVFDASTEIRGSAISSQLVGSHYTSYGYRLIAEAMETKLREFMLNNPVVFGYEFSQMCEDDDWRTGYPYVY